MRRSFSFACGLVMLGASALADALPFTNIFVFGDSLSDTGNLFHYTKNTPLFPDPIPDPEYYYQGRFQNGLSYVEPLAESFGLAAAPFFAGAGGTNYAVGGARSRYHRFDVLLNGGLPVASDPQPAFYPFSLLGQEVLFYNNLAWQGLPLDTDALYVLWGGSNDISDMLTLFFQDGASAANRRLFETASDITSAVNRLVDDGAETLLVPLVPDIGLIPEVIEMGPLAQAVATAYSKSLNDWVSINLAELDARIIRFDTFTFLQEVVADPALFGFSNVTDPCLNNYFVNGPIDPDAPVTQCDNPDEYLFWDINHPSERTNELLAGAMRSAVPEPDVLLLLGAGLAVVWLAWWLRTRKSL